MNITEEKRAGAALTRGLNITEKDEDYERAGGPCRGRMNITGEGEQGPPAGMTGTTASMRPPAGPDDAPPNHCKRRPCRPENHSEEHAQTGESGPHTRRTLTLNTSSA